MNKRHKKGISVLLALSLVFSLSVTAFAYGNEKEISGKTIGISDPFAAMYDSDALFLEEAESLLTTAALEKEREIGADREEDAYLVGSSGILADDGLLLWRDSAAIESSELLTGFRSSKRIDVIAQELSLDVQTVEQLEMIYEDTRTDRFIVKYKGAGLTAASFGARSSSTLDAGGGSVQLLTLPERVNPREFADGLRAKGFASQIEYMQPDFLMGYASLGLEYKEVQEEPDSPPSESPEAPEDDPGSFEDKEDAAGPEEKEDLDEILKEIPKVEETLPEANSEVIVALIDTGVDISHPLISSRVIDGWNFVDNNSNVFDAGNPMAVYHGTHIAGIIVSESPDSVKVMPLKVFGAHGAYTSDILAAIEYAETNGAQIANLSFGSKSYNPALYEAIANSSMLFVASVGNRRETLAVEPVYPASFKLDNVISVASLNADKGFSYYSNYSSSVVDIAARGRNVESSVPGGGYGLQSGTSMAAGFVTGAAGTVLSVENISSETLKARILTSADSLSNLQDKVKSGRCLNPENALLGVSGSYLSLNPADDFDVHGYSPTENELWHLYSAAGDVLQVDAGATHTIVLKEDGTVWAWGFNYFGQCGNGTISFSSSLKQVIGLTDVVSIATGYEHCLAVKSDGTVWAWGWNEFWQLGDGSLSRENCPTPQQVFGLNDVVLVAAGYAHSLALDKDGTVWAWGGNWSGQLGDGSTEYRPIPVQTIWLTDVVSIAAGGYHNLAVSKSGAVLAWGWNADGQLGDGTTTQRLTPVQVRGIADVVYISAGLAYNLALKNDGTVWAWGSNVYGTLGDGTTMQRLTPVQVSGLMDVVSIAARYNHSIAVNQNGKAFAWGWNEFGQLGDGSTLDSPTPEMVSGLSDAELVAVGYAHSIALISDCTVWAWGWNIVGQLGDGSTIDSLVPVQSQTSIVLTSLTFSSSSYSVAIPGNVTVSAVAYDQFDNELSGVVTTYSLQNSYPGVSIDSSTGVVTVDSTAQPGTVTINASSGGMVCSVQLELAQVAGSSVTISAQANKYYDISIVGDNITSFSGTVVKLQYDPYVLELADLCSYTEEAETSAGPILSLGLNVTQAGPGEIRFTVDKPIANGNVWSGVLNVVKLKAISTGSGIVSVS